MAYTKGIGRFMYSQVGLGKCLRLGGLQCFAALCRSPAQLDTTMTGECKGVTAEKVSMNN